MWGVVLSTIQSLVVVGVVVVVVVVIIILLLLVITITIIITIILLNKSQLHDVFHQSHQQLTAPSRCHKII